MQEAVRGLSESQREVTRLRLRALQAKSNFAHLDTSIRGRKLILLRAVDEDRLRKQERRHARDDAQRALAACKNVLDRSPDTVIEDFRDLEEVIWYPACMNLMSVSAHGSQTGRACVRDIADLESELRVMSGQEVQAGVVCDAAISLERHQGHRRETDMLVRNICDRRRRLAEVDERIKMVDVSYSPYGVRFCVKACSAGITATGIGEGRRICRSGLFVPHGSCRQYWRGFFEAARAMRGSRHRLEGERFFLSCR